jgi:hypothetical protein
LAEELRGTDHLKDVGDDGRIILEWVLKICWEIINWIHLAHDRDQWQAVVNTVMNLRFHKEWRNSCLVE